MEKPGQAMPIYGEGLVARLEREFVEDCAVVCAPEAWELVRHDFPGVPRAVVVPKSMEMGIIESQLKAIKQPASWIGIGGGTACDAAKLGAWMTGGRLVLIPSVVSVDAAFTSAVGVRVDHHVRYVGNAHPDRLLVDFDLLRRSPARLNLAGVGDILSIFTALPDWKLGADFAGHAHDAAIAEESAGLLKSLLDGVEDIRALNDAGLKLISDLYVAEVELCDRQGSSRPEEGSEHYFAYCLESLTHKSYIHGELIAMAVVLTGLHQGQDVSGIVAFLDRAGVNWRPADVGVTRPEMLATLTALADFLKVEMQLPYGIFHHKPLDAGTAGLLLDHFFAATVSGD